MPFAPIVMDEHFDSIFTSSKSKYTSEFMTLCYNTKEEWIEIIESGEILNMIETYMDELLISENELLQLGIREIIIQVYNDNKNNKDIMKLLDKI
jgi:predicted NodU family carbamoyl transferase